MNSDKSEGEDNISLVANKLQQYEDEIVKKAKQVEQEMFQLKEQKLELLLKMFKDQLAKDYQNDIQKFKQDQEDEQKKNEESLNKEKNIKLEKIEKMNANIEQQIKTLQLMQEDILEKKEEIENSYFAALEYLKKETQNNILEFQQRCKAQIENKVKEFKGQVSMRNF
ncbi:hypothetical protein ABPG74_003000 [Tetrahymena malaccensis]